MITPYHARYFANELTKINMSEGVQRLTLSLFDACVDLNPHQIEAALFALRSPLTKGVILADEVGLGKTIEAGLVLCQYWAERRRKLLVICPASLRKQWALELSEKFNLPCAIFDSREYRNAIRNGATTPLNNSSVVIISTHFASRMREEIRLIPWDLTVIDEAHKLRNVYRASNKMGQALKWALEGRIKLMLTATPLQNTLLELFGLSILINEHIFGDIKAFREQFSGTDGNIQELRERLQFFCKRTLRKQVIEYIKYTKRRAITRPFTPTDDEQKLYEAVSRFLKREGTYAIPYRQKQLTTLIILKLLASSSHAVAGTLETIKQRLEKLRDKTLDDKSIAELIILDEDFAEDLLDEEMFEEEEEAEEEAGETEEKKESKEPEIDLHMLKAEIEEIEQYIRWARSIGIDTKTRSLLNALEVGFNRMKQTGAAHKALIFTESRRTQRYLKDFLESSGYAGQVVTFNGTNTEPESKLIYEKWHEDNVDSGRTSGSRQIDTRTALIEHFRDNASIMIATEAAAEGVNLQFCSMVINYDLPWNPQRIEQRIGRCHRYGQKHDVVVINFLNQRNYADQRVLELLEKKFKLFSGVFGASDEVLGTIESGLDFEKRILSIYQQCRTPEEIQAAFNQLQKDMSGKINRKMKDTRKLLFEHFDEDVHRRLRMQLDDARAQLDRTGDIFWRLTRFILDNSADFHEEKLSFHLNNSPVPQVNKGEYHLISKNRDNIPGEFLYRLSHPLGEFVVEEGKNADTSTSVVEFDITGHPVKISVVESLKGKKGWLHLQKLTINSFRKEEYLLFSAFDDRGNSIHQEVCEKMFNCSGRVLSETEVPPDAAERIEKEALLHRKSAINISMENNSKFFREERDRLDKWANDLILASEKQLTDTKAQLGECIRKSRQSQTLEEEKEYQDKILALQIKQQTLRQKIFSVEDEIIAKRNKLIDALEKRLTQKTSYEPLFTIRWSVV